MKTLAELKRDAKSGKLSGEMVVRFGSTEIPERLQGIRRIVDANTTGIVFLNTDGKKSRLDIPCASLVEYDDNSITIYRAGLRDLNAEEQAVLDEWKKISSTDEYMERSYRDAMSDGNSTYYQEKFFFKDKGFEYLFGFEENKGMKYDRASGKVRDNKIKGEVDLKYTIYRD